MDRIKTLNLLALLFMSTLSQAQTDTTGIANTDNKVSLKIGLFGISHLNYYGRTDSLRSSGFFPVVELWTDKHTYISAAPIFIHNDLVSGEYAGTVTSLGYMFRNTKWAGNSYISVPVYRTGSGLVQSRLKFQASSSFSKLNRIINITAGVDIKYSDKIDYGATMGLDHLFRFETAGHWILALDPAAYISAGTQRLNSSSTKQSGFPLLPPLQQQVDDQVKRFNILSYEFSMPVVIAKGRVQFVLNPAYVLPQNLIVVQGRPDLSERGIDMFYFSAGLKCRVF